MPTRNRNKPKPYQSSLFVLYANAQYHAIPSCCVEGSNGDSIEAFSRPGSQKRLLSFSDGATATVAVEESSPPSCCLVCRGGRLASHPSIIERRMTLNEDCCRCVAATFCVIIMSNLL